jgi:hypothetical protein
MTGCGLTQLGVKQDSVQLELAQRFTVNGRVQRRNVRVARVERQWAARERLSRVLKAELGVKTRRALTVMTSRVIGLGPSWRAGRANRVAARAF